MGVEINSNISTRCNNRLHLTFTGIELNSHQSVSQQKLQGSVITITPPSQRLLTCLTVYQGCTRHTSMFRCMTADCLLTGVTQLIEEEVELDAAAAVVVVTTINMTAGFIRSTFNESWPCAILSWHCLCVWLVGVARLNCKWKKQGKFLDNTKAKQCPQITISN